VTAIDRLNLLLIIIQRKSRIAQAEKMYTELIEVQSRLHYGFGHKTDTPSLRKAKVSSPPTKA
jgi:hypothetical protein